MTELEKEQKRENQVRGKERWWGIRLFFFPYRALDKLNTILGWINRNTASGTRKERALFHSVRPHLSNMLTFRGM